MQVPMTLYNIALPIMKMAQYQTKPQVQLNVKGKMIRLPVSVRALNLTMRYRDGDIEGILNA